MKKKIISKILVAVIFKKSIMNKKILYLLAFVSYAIMTSCASKSEIVYFQGDTSLNTIYENSIPKIRPNDMLAISVSAADMKATEPFNQNSIYKMRSSTNEVAQNVFTVKENGTIDFPVIGEVYVNGLTCSEAIALFKQKLDPYIVNPGVNITFVNFKVSVIGEVNKPGVFTLPNERITVLEALALAGDLSIQGKRENVMVIREADGKKNIYTLDLTSRTALDSPVYYLAQNDVIYVEPNKARIQTSVVNYSLFVSVAGIIISVIAVLSK